MSDKERLTWIKDNFIAKELYAPFIIEKDIDYYDDLSQKLKFFFDRAAGAGADEESLYIIDKYRKKILEALRSYYRADIAKSNTIILNLLKEIGEDKLAVSTLNNSWAFPGAHDQELQLFRCRTGNPSNAYAAKDMVHLPKSLRAQSGNYRFSIPGNPSLYLANSSYGCWIETGYPAEIDFNVSPVLLDGSQKVFNLAVSVRQLFYLNDFESSRVRTWLKLMMLNIATSYRIEESGRTFKSEYIISQAVMMACKKLKYDGVAYFSKRVTDEVFAHCAINLALFVNYKKEYSNLVRHMKVDDSFNFSVYKNLNASVTHSMYQLRSVANGLITNIGSYDRQYGYRETDFFEFDQFLFESWKKKKNGKSKDEIPWGVPGTK